MKITEIRMRKINNKSRLKAVASITFNDCFVVHGVRLIDGEKGLFMAMPSRKTRRGEFFDVAHPINNDFRIKLEKALTEQYKEITEKEEEEKEEEEE